MKRNKKWQLIATDGDNVNIVPNTLNSWGNETYRNKQGDILQYGINKANCGYISESLVLRRKDGFFCDWRAKKRGCDHFGHDQVKSWEPWAEEMYNQLFPTKTKSFLE